MGRGQTDKETHGRTSRLLDRSGLRADSVKIIMLSVYAIRFMLASPFISYSSVLFCLAFYSFLSEMFVSVICKCPLCCYILYNTILSVFTNSIVSFDWFWHRDSNNIGEVAPATAPALDPAAADVARAPAPAPAPSSAPLLYINE